MALFTYQEFCNIGTAIVLVCTSFLMGIFYGNQPYDYHLLFNKNATQANFDNSLAHYQILHDTARPVIYIAAAIAFVGILGHLIRLYKPNPELKTFEYASLGMYILGICLFITNVKTGIDCTLTHNWGEVTENQGLAVIASSNVIILFVFLGVLLLQCALWYATWDFQKRLKQFYAEEAAAKKEKDKSKGKNKKDTKKNK